MRPSNRYIRNIYNPRIATEHTINSTFTTTTHPENDNMHSVTISRESDNLTFSLFDRYQSDFKCAYDVIIEKNYDAKKYRIPLNEFLEAEKSKTACTVYRYISENEGDEDDGEEPGMHITSDNIYNFIEYGVSVNVYVNSYYLRLKFLYTAEKITLEGKSLIQRFEEYIKSNISPVPMDNKFSIICHNGREFYLKDFKVKMHENRGNEFMDCYNDGFEDVDAVIVNKLSSANSKGIVLLHGSAGTGKTTYLRQLITTIPDKRIIYMSPEMSQRIASPDFISFLMDNPNSILFIEDAETVLLSRESGGNDAVSNLLNVADGILGDALHLQIVCTFNCKREEIDKALLRPGRLIAEYQFTALTTDKTQMLVDKLYNGDLSPTKSEMTIAEIFNMRESIPVTTKKAFTFGFTP